MGDRGRRVRVFTYINRDTLCVSYENISSKNFMHMYNFYFLFVFGNFMLNADQFQGLEGIPAVSIGNLIVSMFCWNYNPLYYRS
jgi:hypothetical protein